VDHVAEPPETEERKSKEEAEQNHETGEEMAQDAKTSSGKSEESSLKPEDLIVGPLPAEELEFEERARKLEAIKKAEELKLAEENRKKEALQKEEERLQKLEEERLRKLEEERSLKAKREAEASLKSKEIAPSETQPPVSESENLLLQGLVNLIQPALDIKMESKMYQRWIKGWDKAIQVHILNEGFVHVLIKDNQMKAAIGKPPREPDIVMEGEYETITSYLNGELDPILMFFDFILLRKMRLVKGLEIKLSNILSGNIIQQARDLYRIDKILKIK
jgi:putative sterol carrier protein